MSKDFSEEIIKIVPILDEKEVEHYLKSSHGYEVIGLYATENPDGLKMNIGYPAKAVYNQAMGNMFGFKNNHGIYFLSGDFPETNDRPIYIITTTTNKTVDSYSQINAAIVGEYDLLELVSGTKTEGKKNRAI